MERPASKPPLITPSASPPASHTFFPQPYRISDQASPAKRPRLSSAPRQFQPHTSASSSTASLDQIDFQKAREASALRMLDVWSNLADRYSRPLDEDDIIDLNTGKVVRDRGVIRGSRHWDLGCFADDVGEEEAEEGDEEEDDDDIDELDSFAAPRGLERQELSAEADVRNMPPVREMDPADAEDLRQFLEAERRRRETCGSEVEETESSVAESHDEGDYESERLRDSVHTEHTDNSVRERSATSEALTNRNTPTLSPEITQTPVQRSATVFVDSGSDDELASYDIDEASIVYRLPKKEEAEDSDSEVEFVEPPLPLPPKPRPKAAAQNSEPKSSRPSEPIRPKPTLQLQTPPLSQTSSLISSVTPSDDYYIQLPPDSSSPLPPSSPPSSHYSSPIKPSRHVQNAHSSGSWGPNSLLEREVSLAPIPRLDLTKISKKNPSLKSKVSKSKLPPSHALQQAEASGSGSSPMVESRNTELPARPRQLPAEEVELSVKARPKMELVLDKRPPFQNNPQAHSSPTHNVETPSVKKDLRRMRSLEDARPVEKGKGKGKTAMFDSFPEDQGVSEDMAQSDDAVIVLSSSPSPTLRRKIRPSSNRVKEPKNETPTIVPRTGRQSHEKPISAKSQHGDKPNSASTTTTKKRKRVVSSSEIEAASLGDALSLSSDKQTQREADELGETPRHTRTNTVSSIGSESSTSVAVKGTSDTCWKPQLSTHILCKYQTSSPNRNLSENPLQSRDLGPPRGPGNPTAMTLGQVPNLLQNVFLSTVIVITALIPTSVPCLPQTQCTTHTLNHPTRCIPTISHICMLRFQTHAPSTLSRKLCTSFPPLLGDHGLHLVHTTVVPHLSRHHITGIIPAPQVQCILRQHTIHIRTHTPTILIYRGVHYHLIHLRPIRLPLQVAAPCDINPL